MIQKGSFSERHVISPAQANKSRVPMKIGYARVSTEDQRLDLQLASLQQTGCDTIFEEKLTGASNTRPVLSRALASLHEGDVLVVWKLDRLGRSLQHLIEIVELLDSRGVGFQSLSDNIDTTTSGGRLLFHIIGAIAEFECAQISERTKAGMQAAKRRGIKMGRPRYMTPDQVNQARYLSEVKHWSLRKISFTLKVNRTTLWRSLSRTSA